MDAIESGAAVRPKPARASVALSMGTIGANLAVSVSIVLGLS
jgi:hypothetical protein